MKIQVCLVVVSLIAICSSRYPPEGAWIIKPTINDPIITTAMEFINDYYQRRDERQREAVEVLGAYMKVVTGYLYVIDLKVKVVTGNKFDQCHVEYLEHSWKSNPFTLRRPVFCTSMGLN